MRNVTPAMTSRAIRRGLAVLAVSVAASPAAAITNDEALALCLSDLTANRGATAISDSRVSRSDREPSVFGMASFGGGEPVEFRCRISAGAVSSVRYLAEDPNGGIDAQGNPQRTWVEQQPDGTVAAVDEEDAGSDPADPVDEESAGADPADPVDEAEAGADPVEAEEELVKPVFQKPGDGGLKRFTEQQPDAGSETADAEDKPLFQKVPQSN